MSIAARAALLKDARLPPSTAKRARQAILNWSNGYASFSEEFVTNVLEWVGVGPDCLLLDPMAGTGTVLLEAQRRGIPCIVADLNPMFALLNSLKGRALLSRQDQIIGKCTEFAERLRRVEREIPKGSQQSAGWFSDRQLELIRRMRALVGLNLSSLSRPRFVSHSSAPSAVADRFIVGALALAAREFALYVGSSNRTWLKPGGIDTMVSVSDCFTRQAGLMMHALDDAYRGMASTRSPKYCSLWSSALSLPLPARSVDLILTSPPYPNRMDYMRMSGPSVQLLDRLYDLDLGRLGGEMIATNKVRHLAPDARPVNLRGTDGRYLTKLLTMIRDERKSDGSPVHGGRTYYYPYFAAYFWSLQRFLREAARVITVDGAVVLVVQDSFRRGIQIEMNKAVRALARAEGLTPTVVAQHPLRNYFGRIRPGVASDPVRRFQTEHVIVMTLGPVQ